MKTTILLEEILQKDLRPLEKYSEYEKLLQEDALAYLGKNESAGKDRPCPGCGKENAPEAFMKDIFHFRQCANCRTLYVSPVPHQEILDELRAEGKGAAYRSKLFGDTLSSNRYQHILLEQLQWMTMTLDEMETQSESYFDYYSYDPNWMKLVLDQEAFSNPVSVSPQGKTGSQVPSSKAAVIPISEVKNTAEVISAFGVLDKISDPVSALEHMIHHLADEGVLFISTTTSGFEYQILADKAPSLVPLDRLTLFSIEALKSLLEERGMEVIEISTPGRLDVEMVHNYFENKAPGETHAFWDNFFNRADDQAFADLQNFLQKHRLSSHLRLTAKRKA